MSARIAQRLCNLIWLSGCRVCCEGHASERQFRDAGEFKVLPWLRRIREKRSSGVYLIFKSLEQGPTFRISEPKYPTKDHNHRILAHQRSRFTHYYFYIHDQVLGPSGMRVASFLPFQATSYLNGHSF